MSDEERKQHPIDPSEVKVDDIMTFTYYVKVKNISNNGNTLSVIDLDSKQQININGKDLIATSHSADQFKEEEKISKTKIAEILISSHNRPFKVSFLKADGEERILRGRLIRPEPLLGRSMVEDLDVDADHKVRQVDHRTINWLIVDGVKYITK